MNHLKRYLVCIALRTAVAFIHMKGVCHRDIKLANVMVQSTQDVILPLCPCLLAATGLTVK